MNQRRAGERLADATHQQVARIGRQRLTAKQKVANIGVAAMALGNAPQREWRDEGIVVFKQDDGLRQIADFGEGGADPARQAGPCRDERARQAFAAPGQINQVGFAENRRAGNHRAGDFRLVFGKRNENGARCVIGIRQRFGKRQPHTRRWIVEQIGHRHIGGIAVFPRHVGLQIGTAERIGSFRPLGRSSLFRPAKKCLYDHLSLETHSYNGWRHHRRHHV
ncbi:hypothetical protein D3C86_1336190 [compost metagenome]